MSTNKNKLMNSLKAEEKKVVKSQPKTYNENRFELADKIIGTSDSSTIEKVIHEKKDKLLGKRTSVYISGSAVEKLNIIENSVYDFRIKASLSEIVSIAIEQLALLDKEKFKELLISHGCKVV